MKVLTLRQAKKLPIAYADSAGFFVRIGGEITACNTLFDAQKAVAFCPQDCTATLMTPAKYAAYVAHKATLA